MTDLLKQLRKSRLATVEVAGFTFTYRRPTDVEAARLHREGASAVAMAQQFVTGWDGVRAMDVVPSTKSDDTVPFDAELWREWCADRPDFWAPISEAVMAAYSKHRSARDDAEKK